MMSELKTDRRNFMTGAGSLTAVLMTNVIAVEPSETGEWPYSIKETAVATASNSKPTNAMPRQMRSGTKFELIWKRLFM